MSGRANGYASLFANRNAMSMVMNLCRHAKTSRSPLATRPIFLASGLLSVFLASERLSISQPPGSFSRYLRPQGRSWPPAFLSLLVPSLATSISRCLSILLSLNWENALTQKHSFHLGPSFFPSLYKVLYLFTPTLLPGPAPVAP
jgi:hypothetical protein